MSRAEKAKEYFLNGYACSQAVALAFADILPVEKESLEKLALPFGGGMGRLRLTCGAVSGMAIVLGLVFSESGADPKKKAATYERVREVCSRFEKENGSLLCGELLEMRKQSDHKTSCGEIVFKATEILEKYLKEQQ